jgi:bifunctional oligoribonuclease and PAP phosphatase NrnA
MSKFSDDLFNFAHSKNLMIDLDSLKEKLATPCRIVITTHHKPDGDAMGSSLGLYHYFIQKGHEVKVISPTDYPDFLHWLPSNHEVMIYTEQETESKAIVSQADLIFCLDFNALSRINDLGEEVRKSSALKVMIDHHLEPEGFEDFRHWNTQACATAQLVYDFIVYHLNDGNFINKEVATCLYTGIMTDSGSFRFPTVTSDLHRIVANLIDAGAENWRIHQLVYDNSTENRLKFLGFCLSSRLQVFKEFNTALISISKEDIKQFEVQTGETEGVVNYALSIQGIKLAAFIVERNDRVKLSLRSIGDFPVNEICKKYFNGGGHKNASGGHSDEPFEKVVEKFISILPEYKSLLLQ